MMDQNYPWYSIVEGDSITQGDIIESCPVMLLPDAKEGDTVMVKEETLDVIVMTQACDFEQDNIQSVILCGLIDAKDVKNKKGTPANIRFFEAVCKGQVNAFHMLDECIIPDYSRNHRCVDLRQLYSISLESLQNIANKKGRRLRLNPPYREQLSQAFARTFMRVGLPNDIDVTKIKLQ